MVIRDKMCSPNQSKTIIRIHISIGNTSSGCSINHFNVLFIFKIQRTVCFLRLIRVGAFAGQIAVAPAPAPGIAAGKGAYIIKKRMFMKL